MFDDTPTVYCTNLAVGMNVLRRGFKLTAALTAGTTATAWLVYRRERSAVPAGSELVRAKSAPPQTTHLKRLATDNLMGGFDAYYLAATWFYDKPLDAAAIKATLEAAVTAMPALAGRRTSDGIVLSNKGARFSVCEEHAGSARDWARADDEVVAAPGVRSFVDTPSSCSGGEQPLFTVRVTNFADGTSAIGIAAPHSLMDGQSYMSVVSALAAAHAQQGRFDGVSVPDFDAATVWEKATSELDITNEPTLPVSYRLLTWIEPLWALGMKRLDSLIPQAKVHLSFDELTELKTAVGKTLKGSGSSKVSLTTNEALSAAFFLALADEPTGPFPTPNPPPKVRMVVNVQGKGLFAGVTNVAGNFSWMEWMDTPKLPKEMTSMAEAAAFFVDLGAKWRDEAKCAACVDDMARFFRIQDIKGYLWDQTDSVENTLFVNNQSGWPTAQISFGAGPPIGYQPWHSHQHLHIVAAPEPPVEASSWSSKKRQRLAGGVDVYLPKDFSPLLGTPAFKQKLLYGWRDGK